MEMTSLRECPVDCKIIFCFLFIFGDVVDFILIMKQAPQNHHRKPINFVDERDDEMGSLLLVQCTNAVCDVTEF